MQVVGGGVTQTLWLLVCIALPFGLLAWLLHWLERQIQLPLVRRFGWGSILWTGWLGTPVHELSHAAMCIVFRHRINEMALFRPDKNNGRLGYVKHSFNRENYYQVIGNFFIGLAPLVGGTILLFLLLWLFYPAAAQQAFVANGMSEAIAGGKIFEALSTFGKLTFGVLSHAVTGANVLSLRFWLFLYLVLCVGSHMAPSLDDYRGAMWGAWLVLVMLFLTSVAFLAFGGEGGVVARIAPLFGPALAMFSLCAVLCGLSAIVVLLFTSAWDLVFGEPRPVT